MWLTLIAIVIIWGKYKYEIAIALGILILLSGSIIGALVTMFIVAVIGEAISWVGSAMGNVCKPKEPRK